MSWKRCWNTPSLHSSHYVDFDQMVPDIDDQLQRSSMTGSASAGSSSPSSSSSSSPHHLPQHLISAEPNLATPSTASLLMYRSGKHPTNGNGSPMTCGLFKPYVESHSPHSSNRPNSQGLKRTPLIVSSNGSHSQSSSTPSSAVASSSSPHSAFKGHHYGKIVPVRLFKNSLVSL